MMMNFHGSVLAVVIAGLLWGCVSVSLPTTTTDRCAYADPADDQPWVGPLVRAQGCVAIRSSSMGTVRWLEWKLPDESLIDSRKITARSKRFLERAGVWNDFVSHEESHRAGLRWVRAKLTVASLDPLVVIISPGRMLYWDRPMAYYTLEPPDIEDQRWPVKLLHGFDYGTMIEDCSQLQWFAPELDIEPTGIEMADGEARFVVDGVTFVVSEASRGCRIERHD